MELVNLELMNRIFYDSTLSILFLFRYILIIIVHRRVSRTMQWMKRKKRLILYEEYLENAYETVVINGKHL